MKKIVDFIKDTYDQAGKNKAVIAVSGGIDSAVSLTLLTQALGPEAVFPLLLPYHDQEIADSQELVSLNQIPEENISIINIGPVVYQFQQTLQVDSSDRMRLGNIMARARMIAVFDKAKNLDALVCGTENKSEHYLGYFTRYGDGASDLEPLLGLYKTQVRALAEELHLPAKFLEKDPSAGLWQGQTDEQELGFTYEIADQVLTQLIDERKPVVEIKVEGVDESTIGRVITRVKGTEFKHQVPYSNT